MTQQNPTVSGKTPVTDETRALVTQFIEYLTTGRHDDALSLFAPDAHWHLLGQTGEFATARAYGMHDVRDLMGALKSTVTHSHHVSVGRVLADGNQAAVEIYSGGKTDDDRTYDQHIAFHVEVTAGKISALREYLDTHHLKLILEGP